MINFYIYNVLINSNLHYNCVVLLRHLYKSLLNDVKIFVKSLYIRVYNVCVTPIKTNSNIEKTAKKEKKLTNVS